MVSSLIFSAKLVLFILIVVSVLYTQHVQIIRVTYYKFQLKTRKIKIGMAHKVVSS